MVCVGTTCGLRWFDVQSGGVDALCRDAFNMMEKFNGTQVAHWFEFYPLAENFPDHTLAIPTAEKMIHGVFWTI